MEKTINFFGKSNRYQMKKVLKKDEPKEKINKNMDLDFFIFENQQAALSDPFSKCYECIMKAISAKIESYKYQDRLKNRITEEFIGVNDILEMLKESSACYYCKKDLLVIYKFKREPMQWTLDRIDNDLAHEKANVVLSCLKCNLERRCKNKEKFLFTKNLIVCKM